MLRLYNSLTNKKEKFKPLNDDQVGIYSCGPTVYDRAHIGNLRSFIFADTLQRVLKFNDHKINWVMNITDIDDKTIEGSKARYPDLGSQESLKKFTSEYEKLFWQDLEKLNIEKPNQTPHAIEFIPQIQKLMIKILNNGYAYEKDGSFYFDVKKYSQKFTYGRLAKLNLKELKTGTRMLSDEYEKEDLQDFALWKKSKEGEPSWDLEWQGKNFPGRPGWHIECSAMSQEYLGIPFDIHTGGVDLKFPHHENEIAQSTAGCQTKKLANFFLHNEHVLVNKQKMSKSLNNFYTLQDLEERNFNPLAFRYLCLNSHYRSKMNFAWEGLEAAQNALDGLYQLYSHLSYVAKNHLDEHKNKKSIVKKITPPILSPRNVKKIKKYRKDFLAAINNDLNTSQALAVMQVAIKDNILSDAERKNLLDDFDKVLGLNISTVKLFEIPGYVQRLAKQREVLRQEKKWAESDKLRAEIENLGYQIEDTDQGPKIKKL